MRAALLTLALLAGLAQADPFVWPDVWTSDPGEAVPGGILRTVGEVAPHTLNPFGLGPDAVAEVVQRGAALLVRGPASDEWLPYAAQAFTVSEDGRVVDMVLREELKWSDGTPITVDDYLFSYQAETDPAVGSNRFDSYFLDGDLITLEATGDRTLRWTFPAPDRTALGVAALLPAPDHILGEIYREGGAEALKAAWRLGVDPSETVWSSAFVPVSLLAEERLVFERNPYFGEWNVDERGRVLPFLDGVAVTLVASPEVGLNLYLAGELDLFLPGSLDEVGIIQVAIEGGDLAATLVENASPMASSRFIVFNWNRASDPFKEALFRSTEFRRAMSHLVDREAITELVYGGAATAMYSGVYEVLGEWLSRDLPRFEYDPAAAASLLAGIGFAGKNEDGLLVDGSGRELRFTLATASGNNEWQQIAQLVRDSAFEVGVGIELQVLEFGLLADQLLTEGPDRPFDAILIGLSGGDRDWPFGSNVVPCGTNLHLYNKEDGCLTDAERMMEALYFEGRRELDLERAREIGFELQRLQAELQPFVYTVSPTVHYSWLDSLCGLHPASLLTDVVGPHELELLFRCP